jgi:solute carrier family 25 protein 44
LIILLILKKELDLWIERSSKTGIYDIKWSMIDKKKYFPLTIVNMFAVRSLLYPFNLVRTRLQVQTTNDFYTGTFHAIKTSVKYEGATALYKGFWLNSLHLAPHVLYITSYEKVLIIVLGSVCIKKSIYF